MRIQTTLVLMLFTLIFLASCKSSFSSNATPTLARPNEFTQTYEPLSEETLNSLIEVTLLESPLLDNSILKVSYIPEDNIAVGIYDEKRRVVGWSLDTNSIIFNHDLDIVTSKGLVFTKFGKNLIGATKHVFEDGTEYIDGIALWDVQIGELIQCITYPCQDNSIPGGGFLGLATDPHAERLAIFSELGVDISSVSGDFPGLIYTINAEDASYPWLIGSVAFDERHRRYAVIFQEGRVYVFDNERSMHHRIISPGEEGDRVPITDAQIDATGRWLVVARGETTQVLNLNDGKVLLEINVSNPALMFDETGELLFVGSTNKLTIYTVETGEKIAEYDTVGITSLAISEDNRIVIWGDVEGEIHVWGKPIQQP